MCPKKAKQRRTSGKGAEVVPCDSRNPTKVSGLISRIASFEPFESGPFLKGRELPSCVWDAVHGNIDRERGGEKKFFFWPKD